MKRKVWQKSQEKYEKNINGFHDYNQNKNFSYRCHGRIIKTTQLFKKDNKEDKLISIHVMKIKDIPYNISFKVYRCLFSMSNLTELQKNFQI